MKRYGPVLAGEITEGQCTKKRDGAPAERVLPQTNGPQGPQGKGQRALREGRPSLRWPLFLPLALSVPV